MHQTTRIVSLFAALLVPMTALAGPLWDSLTPSEQAQVLNGETVTHVTHENSVMAEQSYVWVKRLAPKADPEGAAAIYWDFDGAESYLAPAGVVSYDVVAPYGLSGKNINVVLQIPGLGQVPYTAEATVYRTGAKRYSIRWHVPQFDVQPAPGLRQTSGAVNLEDFPGDCGGALFVHSAQAILTPEVANDPGYTAATLGFHLYLTQLLKERFEQGPNLLQLLKLKAAVFPW